MFSSKIQKSYLGHVSLLTVLCIILFEGALNKWLGIPLYALVSIRDSIVGVSVLFCAYYNIYSRSKSVSLIALIWSMFLIIYGLIQCLLVNKNLISLVIGIRFWLLYLWYAIGIVLWVDVNEYNRIRSSVSYLVIFLAPLSVLQNMLPPSHFINRQPSGELEGIFLLAEGIVRVTGTFTFTVGYTCFIAFATPLIFDLGRSYFKYTAVVALTLMVATSGSRAAVFWFFSVLTIIAILPVIILTTHRSFLFAMTSIAAGILVFYIGISIAPKLLDAYEARIQNASRSENVYRRILVLAAGEPHVYENYSVLGKGLGMGSNATGQLTGGSKKDSFRVGESESGKIVGELGFIGLFWLVMKFIFYFFIALKSFQYSKSLNTVMPTAMSLTVIYGTLTWPMSGQLSAHGIAYISLICLFLMFRNCELLIKSRNNGNI